MTTLSIFKIMIENLLISLIINNNERGGGLPAGHHRPRESQWVRVTSLVGIVLWESSCYDGALTIALSPPSLVNLKQRRYFQFFNVKKVCTSKLMSLLTMNEKCTYMS